MPAPIFIVGVQRSGTTLLAAMLAAHSRLSCGPETHFFRRLADVDPNQLCKTGTWPHEAIRFVSSITHTNFTGETSNTTTLLSKYLSSREKAESFLLNRDPDIPSILASVVEPYMLALGKCRWVEKTPDHIRFLSPIRKYFPDSPIIRIVRDPRDTALSLMNVPWGAQTFLEALLYWKQMDEAGDAFIKDDQYCHTLRYEDLIRSPREELEKLCAFIEEKFEEQMLDTSITGKQVNSREVPWKTKASQPVDRSRDSVWRRELGKAENMLAEAFLGGRMKAYGYDTVEQFSFRGAICPEFVEIPKYEEPLKRVISGGIRFWEARSNESVSARILLGNPDIQGCRSGGCKNRVFGMFALLAKILGSVIGGKKLYWIPDRKLDQSTGTCSKMLRWLLRPYRVGAGWK